MNYQTFLNLSIYQLILVTTVFAVIWGLIFKDMLEYQVAFWDKNRQSQKTINYQTPNIIVTYLVMTFLTFVCVGATLSTFQIGNLFSYIMAAVVVLPTALLIWVQLGSMLDLLVREGSAALKIDD